MSSSNPFSCSSSSSRLERSSMPVPDPLSAIIVPLPEPSSPFPSSVVHAPSQARPSTREHERGCCRQSPNQHPCPCPYPPGLSTVPTASAAVRTAGTHKHPRASTRPPAQEQYTSRHDHDRTMQPQQHTHNQHTLPDHRPHPRTCPSPYQRANTPSPTNPQSHQNRHQQERTGQEKKTTGPDTLIQTATTTPPTSQPEHRPEHQPYTRPRAHTRKQKQHQPQPTKTHKTRQPQPQAQA